MPATRNASGPVTSLPAARESIAAELTQVALVGFARRLGESV